MMSNVPALPFDPVTAVPGPLRLWKVPDPVRETCFDPAAARLSQGMARLAGARGAALVLAVAGREEEEAVDGRKREATLLEGGSVRNERDGARGFAAGTRDVLMLDADPRELLHALPPACAPVVVALCEVTPPVKESPFAAPTLLPLAVLAALGGLGGQSSSVMSISGFLVGWLLSSSPHFLLG
jgi:hypothetical protein